MIGIGEWCGLSIDGMIKKYRKLNNLTQKELGARIGVSDKTISSWENNRTAPDLEMLTLLYETLDIPPNECIPITTGGAQQMKHKVSMNSFFLILFLFIVFFSFFLINFQYKNEWLDRFNPILKSQTGYTTLPLGNIDGSTEFWVVNDAFGHGTWLTFSVGETTDEKKYAIVKHKGLYVKEARLISWDSIPTDIKDLIHLNYDESMKRMNGEPNHH